MMMSRRQQLSLAAVALVVTLWISPSSSYFFFLLPTTLAAEVEVAAPAEAKSNAHYGDDEGNNNNNNNNKDETSNTITSKSLIKKTMEIPTKEIAPSVHMPVLSIGTGGKQSKKTTQIVSNWLSLGGTGIDTSPKYKGAQEKIRDVIYDNIVDVYDDGMDGGNIDMASEESSLLVSPYKREDIFLTSKVRDCNATKTIKTVKGILSKLGTTYLDLLLIHQPWNSGTGNNCVGAWRILEQYYELGVARSIGVSNFQIEDLYPIIESEEVKVKPHVNQIRLNLYEKDMKLIEYCETHGITIESYSPLRPRRKADHNMLEHPTIIEIADTHHVSPHQVAIKWILQHDWVVAFQSSSKRHQQIDSNVFHFTLTGKDMKRLDNILNDDDYSDGNGNNDKTVKTSQLEQEEESESEEKDRNNIPPKGEL